MTMLTHSWWAKIFFFFFKLFIRVWRFSSADLPPPPSSFTFLGLIRCQHIPGTSYIHLIHALVNELMKELMT